jgi:hypothetical protein
MDEQSILQFADSVNQKLPGFDLHTSMLFMNDKSMLYVDRYTQYANPVLFIEHSEEGNSQSVLRKYYFKNDSLIFVYEREHTRTASGEMITDRRSYFRNNTLFKKESRTAEKAAELQTMVYKDADKMHETSLTEDYKSKINTLADAAAGRNQFEMVFDQVSNYSNAEYLILKSKEQNNYTAKIRIKQRDALIDSLHTMPELFKDEKLNLAWKVEDKEAVYIPTATGSVTSASGLNK